MEGIQFVRRKGQKTIRVRMSGGEFLVTYPYRYPLFLVKRSVYSDGMLQSVVEKEKEKTKKLESLALREEVFKVHTKKERDAYIKEYGQAAMSLVETCAARMGVTYSSIIFKRTKSRFGSCSSKGVLTFHYKIFFMNEKMKEYLIVHELAHLEEMNHSKRFWDIVKAHVPDVENAKQQLLLLSSYL